jgi:hypothetical protein
MVKEIIINDVFYLLREERMRGLIIKEAANELGVSSRTIFRMIMDGRLKAEKVAMPYKKDIWIIDPMSVARIQVRKEMEKEIELDKKNKNGWGAFNTKKTKIIDSEAQDMHTISPRMADKPSQNSKEG